MNFRDKAIVISKKPLQERFSILTVLTENHGIYSGLIKLGKNSSNISEGSLVDYFWQARLDNHLGFVKCEQIKSYHSHIVQNKTKLYAFNSIVGLIKAAFAEREPHRRLFYKMLNYLELLKINFCFGDYFFMELDILEEAGYGLDLSKCADTGKSDDLYYVSPKSGRAVSRSSGEAFADKLLLLPNFLHQKTKQKTKGSKKNIGSNLPNRESTSPELSDQETIYTSTEFIKAIELSGYFFQRYIFSGTKLPPVRHILTCHLLEKFRCHSRENLVS